MLIFNQLRFPFSSLHLLASCILFHIARHTFATTVTLENGVALETVQKMLGHKNIRTTQVYAKMTKRRIGMEMENLADVLDKGLQPAIG